MNGGSLEDLTAFHCYNTSNSDCLLFQIGDSVILCRINGNEEARNCQQREQEEVERNKSLFHVAIRISDPPPPPPPPL